MENRIYYLPKSNIGKFILNRIVDTIPCSIGDMKTITVQNESFFKISITSTKDNFPKISNILQFYGALDAQGVISQMLNT